MPPPSSLVGRSTRAARGVRGDPEESEEPRLSFEELFELFRKKVEYSLENRKSFQCNLARTVISKVKEF